MRRKIISVPPLCKINRDKDGTVFEIDRDGIGEKVELWWDRSTKGNEMLFVRQENVGMQMADVVALSLAQVYALIDATNRAVMDR